MTNDNMGVLRQLAIAVLADRLYILGSDQWAAPELVARWNAEITPTTILELTRELAAARALLLEARMRIWHTCGSEGESKCLSHRIDAALAGEKK